MFISLIAQIAMGVCPWFSEIHADPTLVSDDQGEFIEISNIKANDTLAIYLDSILIASLSTTIDQNHLILCPQDSILAAPDYWVQCNKISKSLINSKPITLRLIQGDCNDSTTVPSAIAGHSWQRVNDTSNSWIKATASPKYAWPQSTGVQNAFGKIQHTILNSDTLLAWFTLGGSGAKSIVWKFDNFLDTLRPSDTLIKPLPKNWVILQAEIIGDDFPLDNRQRIWVGSSYSKPLRITEISANPQNNEPDWIELKNNFDQPISIGRISICSEMDSSNTTDFLNPAEYLIITENWSQLVAARPALNGTKYAETSKSYSLRATNDTAIICLDQLPIDQSIWHEQNQIPSSPGRSSETTSSKPKLLHKIVSLTNPQKPLLIQIFKQGNFEVKIIDRNYTITGKVNIKTIGIHQLQIPYNMPIGPGFLLIQSDNLEFWRFRIVVIP